MREIEIDRDVCPDVVDDAALLRATSLEDLDFEDVYVGEKYSFFLNLETSLNEMTPPLVGAPPSLTDALADVRKALVERFESSGKYSFFFDNGTRRYRVQVMNTIQGLTFDCRWVKQPPRLAEIVGLPPMTRRVLQIYGSGGAGNIRVRPGLILITGETASGKTTFGLSTVVEFLTLYGRVAVSAENPVEVIMQGRYGEGGRGYFFQHDVSAMGGYAATLEAAMRMTPRIVYIGEIRRPEEAILAVEASLNGHIVIATMHSNSIIGAIERLSSMTGNSNLANHNLAEGLIAVTNQKLFRRKGQKGKEISMKSLFLDDEPGPRSMIRMGQTFQLATAIENQANKIKLNQLPVFEGDGKGSHFMPA